MSFRSAGNRLLLGGAFYLFAIQPSFAQAAGHSLSFRGVVVIGLVIAGAYWGVGYYVKKHGGLFNNTQNGFHLPPAAWFVIALIAAVIGNMLIMIWMSSFPASAGLFLGVLGIFYFVFGWSLPLTVTAFAQMLQNPAPKSLADAHTSIALPTLAGYYLFMLWGNDFARAIGLTIGR